MAVGEVVGPDELQLHAAIQHYRVADSREANRELNVALTVNLLVCTEQNTM